MGKLTKTQRRALEWFAAQNGPAFLFGATDPQKPTRKKLVALGLVDETRPATGFGSLRYSITPAGRLALQEGEGK